MHVKKHWEQGRLMKPLPIPLTPTTQPTEWCSVLGVAGVCRGRGSSSSNLLPNLNPLPSQYTQRKQSPGEVLRKYPSCRCDQAQEPDIGWCRVFKSRFGCCKVRCSGRRSSKLGSIQPAITPRGIRISHQPINKSCSPRCPISADHKNVG